MKHFSNILYKFINSNNLKICIHMIVEHLLSPPLQHLRYKMIVKLMAEESSATDPTTINLSDYSSISSSEGDYTDTDIDDDYFLFQNVRKLARRKRRKMPPEEYKKTKEKKKLIDYESESDTSSSDGDYFYNNPSQPYSEVSLHYIQVVPEKLFLREDLKTVKVNDIGHFSVTPTLSSRHISHQWHFCTFPQLNPFHFNKGYFFWDTWFLN